MSICAEDEKFKCIDKDYLTIKEKIGTGGFCKVKHATCKVYREKEGKEEVGK